MCLLGVSMMNNHIYGSNVPQNPHFGGLNMDFKPNMRKIQIAISSDLCITLTWNLTGSCCQQQRLRGWSRMVVNNSKMADGRHFENRYIAISQRKIIRFSWNFVHSSNRFWTGWMSRDQKLKSCIGQTPSLTERIFCIILEIKSTLAFCNRDS